jgi:hypothetical protein
MPTEEQIERLVERKIDSLDKRFMSFTISQKAYDSEMAEIRAWENRQYNRVVRNAGLED